MEKLYHDNKSGYTYAPFPKPTVAITRPYVCPSPRIVAPTPTDSLSIDSTTIIRRLDSLVMETDPQSVNF
jgi:penicillin-binding protein 1A